MVTSGENAVMVTSGENAVMVTLGQHCNANFQTMLQW